MDNLVERARHLAAEVQKLLREGEDAFPDADWATPHGLLTQAGALIEGIISAPSGTIANPDGGTGKP